MDRNTGMRALVLREYGEPLVITDRECPQPDPTGAVVEVEACGICRSDWHAWQGHGEWADDQVPRGQILGHEPAGRIVAVGDQVESLGEGDRVAVPFNLGDGTCVQCRRGHGNVCTDGWALGFEPAVQGAFAEYVHIPRADFNVVPLPSNVSTTAMAALGCRYATAYHAIAHRAVVGEDDRITVHGCGGLGLAAVEIAAALGGTVIAIDVRDEPLELAETLGAAETLDASDVDDVPSSVRRFADAGVEVSIDALGTAETVRDGVRSLCPRGRHVRVGLTTREERGEVALPVDEMTRWDISFLGSRGMPPTRYDELLALVEEGVLDPGQLVTRECRLDDVSDRLASMSDYDTVGVEVVTAF